MSSATSYPRDVLVNFRKLDDENLKKILAYYKYDLDARESSHEDLASAVARLFRVNTGVRLFSIPLFLMLTLYL